ncbi:MAG: NAD(+)/NADH kinase [Patescibacteria group bacterium]
MASQIKNIAVFYRPENSEAVNWHKKISQWVSKKHPRIKISDARPQAVVVLGGDGTILEAARKYQKSGAIIFGLNLGHVGFLASVRKPGNFLRGLDKLLKGQFSIAKRMMLEAKVSRRGRQVFSAVSLNDFIIQNPVGIVEISVTIEGHPVQYVHGTGFLVATATGSTAYNLSAHGPIVMPDFQGMILSEILDHNIPTPSMIVKPENKVGLEIIDFRQRGLLFTKDGKKADVLLISDGERIFPLDKKDKVIIKRSPKLVKLAELEKNYFFKSLQEKFSFR